MKHRYKCHYSVAQRRIIYDERENTQFFTDFAFCDTPTGVHNITVEYVQCCSASNRSCTYVVN